MALIHHPERFHRPRSPILGIVLVCVQPVDIESRNVDIRPPRQDPMREHSAEASAGENADGVEPCRHEIIFDFG